MKGSKFSIRGVTSCEIQAGVRTRVATAYCSVSDVFSKEKGRKVALAKALQGWDREFRTRVWEAYHNRGKKVIYAEIAGGTFAPGDPLPLGTNL